MKISILGTGNFATALGKVLVKSNQIYFGSRTPEQKTGWVKTIGEHAEVVSIQEAADASDVIMLALNWPGNAVIETLQSIRSLQGKIVVDVTNVLQADFHHLNLKPPLPARKRSGVTFRTSI